MLVIIMILYLYTLATVCKDFSRVIVTTHHHKEHLYPYHPWEETEEGSGKFPYPESLPSKGQQELDHTVIFPFLESDQRPLKYYIANT